MAAYELGRTVCYYHCMPVVRICVGGIWELLCLIRIKGDDSLHVKYIAAHCSFSGASFSYCADVLFMFPGETWSQQRLKKSLGWNVSPAENSTSRWTESTFWISLPGILRMHQDHFLSILGFFLVTLYFLTTETFGTYLFTDVWLSYSSDMHLVVILSLFVATYVSVLSLILLS